MTTPNPSDKLCAQNLGHDAFGEQVLYGAIFYVRTEKNDQIQENIYAVVLNITEICLCLTMTNQIEMYEIPHRTL